MPEFIAVVFVRVICAIGGILSIYLGYKLFAIATQEQGEFTARTGKTGSLSLKRVAPGVFFALFGAAVLIYCASRPFKSDRTKDTSHIAYVLSPMEPSVHQLYRDIELIQAWANTRKKIRRDSLSTYWRQGDDTVVERQVTTWHYIHVGQKLTKDKMFVLVALSELYGAYFIDGVDMNDWSRNDRNRARHAIKQWSQTHPTEQLDQVKLMQILERLIRDNPFFLRQERWEFLQFYDGYKQK
jgi:hypothetical protein